MPRNQPTTLSQKVVTEELNSSRIDNYYDNRAASNVIKIEENSVIEDINSTSYKKVDMVSPPSNIQIMTGSAELAV